MQFINNWSRSVTLAPGVTSLALDLPDGEYRLTLADSKTTPTRWEVVGVEVAGGMATLLRGLEDTADQDWPSGSVIYLAITAGLLNDIFARLAALEVGGGAPATHQLIAASSPSDDTVGFQYPGFGNFGSISPATAMIGGEEVEIYVLSTSSIMNGVNLALQLSASVTATIRVKIEGLMPGDQEWAELSISNDTSASKYVEFMAPMVDGQTYNVWIEEV